MTPKQIETCQRLDAMKNLIRELDQAQSVRSLVVRMERVDGYSIIGASASMPLAASGWSSAFRAEAWKR